MSNEIDDFFEIEVIEPETVDGRLPALRHNKEDIQENVDVDYEVARTNLHNILIQGGEALNKAFRVAIDSEHPTAFESATELAATLAKINEQLLNISEKRQKIRGSTGQEDSGKTVNNAIFVGTTAELQKILKGE